MAEWLSMMSGHRMYNESFADKARTSEGWKSARSKVVHKWERFEWNIEMFGVRSLEITKISIDEVDASNVG